MELFKEQFIIALFRCFFLWILLYRLQLPIFVEETLGGAQNEELSATV